MLIVDKGGVNSMGKREATVVINTEDLDEAIEKANRLVELLTQASNLIDSLSEGVDGNGEKYAHQREKAA